MFETDPAVPTVLEKNVSAQRPSYGDANLNHPLAYYEQKKVYCIGLRVVMISARTSHFRKKMNNLVSQRIKSK